MLLPNVYNLGRLAGQAVGSLLSRQNLPPLPTPRDIWEFLLEAPSRYKTWWLDLVTKDPIHVLIETTLVLSLVYIVMSSRSKDWRKDMKDKLSKAEQEELLREWKEHGKTPLAPSMVPAPTRSIVVHKMDGRTLEISIGDSKKTKKVLNFANNDFLSMAANKPIKEASRNALSKYGCGSCGPRGFYGTIDVHLKLEDAISKFTNTDGAIMYSDGASTVTSTVAAFAKRGDLLVVDDGVYEPLLAGITISRANIKWFRHNDMDDLRKVLETVQKKDKALGRRPNDQRRFIIVEGLYRNSGTIAPLDKIVAMKHEFNYRLILDESFSFGTLGKTGRGALELFDRKHMYDAEIVCISMENSLGSIGGVTVGNEEVVDHQRLSGAGYCFSASSPPFTASAAIRALEQLEKEPTILASLQRNRDYFYQKINKLLNDDLDGKLMVTSDERSPMVFLEFAEPRTDPAKLMNDIEAKCLEQGLAILSMNRPGSGEDLPPALLLTVSSILTERDLNNGLAILKRVLLSVL